MFRFPLSLFLPVLATGVVPAFGALVPLRLPIDGGWRSFVRDPAAVGPAGGGILIYPEDRAGQLAAAQRLRQRVALQLDDPTEAASIAADHALTVVGPAPGTGDNGWWLFDAASPAALIDAAPALMEDPRLTQVHFLLYRKPQRRLIPNDPLFTQQWHLRNTGQSSGMAGIDVNAAPVWDSFKGTGKRIAIVDDGLQTSHPDLSPNVDLVNDHDWNDATPDDPSPDVLTDFHGTSCAGVAAGRGNNNLGISGAAPEATLVGLRLIAAGVSDAEEAEALAWRPQVIDIYSNSWGPGDDGKTLEAPGPLVRAAFANSAATGRGSRGSIFVWAGGNGRESIDNSNNDGYANSIYTVAVAALTNTGAPAYYSEAGANLLISTPSSGGTLGIVTADLMGSGGYNNGSLLADNNYTNDFGGTSSACPLAAGCIALMLQANPNLGWRDVKEILIRSAAKVSPASPGWATNGAGFHFHHDYGAGLLNAQTAVILATAWTNLPAATTAMATESGLTTTIPDNNATGIVRSFNLAASNLRVEHVTLRVDLRHTSRGHLNVTLTSPTGTASQLAVKHTDSGDNYQDWTFSTVRCWGENSAGTWTLRLSDTTSGALGTYRSATLTIHGTPAGPVNLPPSITAGSLTPSGPAFTDMTLGLAGVISNDPEGDPITLAWQWQESSDGSIWTDIAGATAANLPLTNTQSGKLVRCRIRPIAGAQSGADWLTDAVPVNRRPVQFVRRGSPYSYDSDLFLTGGGTTLTRDIILHEFSQGPSGGTSEWIELLVVQPTDLRGWKLGDRAGNYVTFSNVNLWASVPSGTLIVIYRGGGTDPAIPVALDDDVVDGRLIIAHNNLTYFNTGAAWGGLSNTNAEAILLTRAAATIADGLSYNSDSTQLPALAAVGSARTARFIGGLDTDAESASSWQIADQATSTPGMPNDSVGSPNSGFIAGLRNGSFTQLPRYRFSPASAVLDTLAINGDSGIISGIINLPTGKYLIALERFASTGTPVAQAYDLFVSDPATDAADPDLDGLTSLLETALGLDPALPSQSPSSGVRQADGTWLWQILLPAGFSGTGNPSYQLEYSTDLITWLPGTTTVAGNVLTNATTRLLTLRHTIPGNPAPVFTRLRVSVP